MQSYRLSTSGKNNYMGRTEKYIYEDRDGVTRYGTPAEPVPSGGVVEESEVFQPVEMQDGALTLYVPTRLNQVHDYAEMVLIYWYDELDPQEDDNPVLMEYYSRQDEVFVLTATTPVVSSESQLECPVKEPTVVDVQGRKWHLFIRYYFQTGEQCRQYELMLRNENGEMVRPNGDVKVYLPYPAGYDYDAQGMTYTLDHYGMEGYTFGEFETPTAMTVTPTEYGLCFVTDSFSPFVLGWNEDDSKLPTPVPAPTAPAPTTAVPKTGDNTPVGLWMGLILLSAAGMLAMRRRMHI